MKKMLNFFAFLYMVFPLIVIPVWAYLNKSWFLLLGIAFSYLGSYSALSPRFKSLIFIFTMLSVGVWIGEGFSIHQYFTFFFFCSLWGYLIFKITDEYDTMSKSDDEKMADFEKNYKTPDFLKRH
jgi:hypothetical protein